MLEMRVDISELKSEGSDLIKELIEFLKEKTETEVETATNEIIVKDEEKAIPKKYMRVLLRKFLHKNELRDQFRVISGKDVLIVKERKISEQE